MGPKKERERSAKRSWTPSEKRWPVELTLRNGAVANKRDCCLIGTAKLNGYGPRAFLRSVLERIAELPITRITDLLPWNIEAGKLRPISGNQTAAISTTA